MLNVIQTIAERWIWFVLLFVALSFVFLRQAIRSRRTAKESIFGLEREQEFRRAATARGRVLLMLLLAAAVYGLNRYGMPLLPLVADAGEPTPTIAAVAATDTATPSALAQFPLGTAVAVTGEPTVAVTVSVTSTATPGTPTATPEATPTSPPPPPASCPNPGAQISSPGSGATVSGVVTVSGTASGDAFQFYKLEVSAGEQPGAWSVVGDIHNSPVQGGTLGSWSTAGLAPGPYWLRLVVVDQTGNYPNPCQVRVTVG